jgi:signal transduction histidine kinase
MHSWQKKMKSNFLEIDKSEELQKRIERLKKSEKRLNIRNEKLCAEKASLKREIEILEKDCSRFRSLLDYLQETNEQERTLIVHKIYDELGTMLTALKMDLNLMSEELSDKAQEIQKFRDASNRHIDEAIQELRRLSEELRPPILDHLGLASAIQWRAGVFTKQTGIPCKVMIEQKNLAVGKKISVGLFRILRGLLENVTQHAQAKSVLIRLKHKEKSLVLTVEDDGLGITADKLSDPKSLGLISMHERAKSLKGKMTINRSKNGGTKVTIKVPWENKRRHDKDDQSVRC